MDATRRKGVHVEVEVVGPSPVFDTGIWTKLSALYLKFVEEISCAFQRVKTNESTILLEDFTAHVGNDAGVGKGVIGRHGDADVNDNGRLLLQLCCSNALCII